MKINIGIDLERLRDPNSGLGQFCKHLGANLLNLKQENISFQLYCPKKYSAYLKGAKHIVVGILDKLFGVKNDHLQLFHCTHQDSHLFPKTIPTVITIHDLNFLEKYTSDYKKQKKLKVLQSKVSKAKGITFISNYTKQMAAKHLVFPNVPTKVIYNGNCLNTGLEPKKPAAIISSDFLFSIGIVRPKKNFHTLLPLVKASNCCLVIAGTDSHEYATSIKDLANTMGIADKVILLGAVSEQEKLWLYQNCKAFVFPSLSEGFGLPVIEAMSLGKPVFLSNKTSLPEVGGKQAYYWNNFEANHMIEIYLRGMTDFENSKNKPQELMDWAQQFNWQKTAQDYLDFYSEVYKTIK
jgi:glycosyltransferase involved in cell wall biosynthesis